MLEHTRAVGDILTKLAITIQNDGVARDLTGKSVTFEMYTLAGVAVVTGGSVTVSSPTLGEVEYDFQAADVANAGVFKAWFIVEDVGNEPDSYPDDDDGIQITIFSRTADTTPPEPSIDIVALAAAPIRTRTVEGTVEERSVDELIKADQYTTGKTNGDAVPWGLRFARTKPGGMTT
jgi:hypothetical protein